MHKSNTFFFYSEARRQMDVYKSMHVYAIIVFTVGITHCSQKAACAMFGCAECPLARKNTRVYYHCVIRNIITSMLTHTRTQIETICKRKLSVHVRLYAHERHIVYANQTHFFLLRSSTTNGRL